MSIIRYIKQIIKVGVYETKIILFSSKFVLISILSFIMMDSRMRPYRSFAMTYDLTMPPAVLPFGLSDSVYCNILFLLLIMLFSNVPLKNRGQGQVMQRSGLTTFGGGHLLSVALVSVVFLAEQLIYSVIVCMPYVNFGDWGKLWGSVASGLYLELGFPQYFNVSEEILRNYTPLQAIGAASVLFLLTGICYGVIEFLLNGLSRGKLGTIVLSIWSVAWIFVSTSKNDMVRGMMRISPQIWNNLSLRTTEENTWIMCRIAVIILLMVIINMIVIRKRKLLLVR